jgi:sigma-B regulation protein RsbU (phosphoserine phosphatase)
VRDERVYDLSALLKNFEKARVDRELKTAAEVQHALLSRGPWRTNGYEVAGDSIACRMIGGDFFDCIDLPSRELAVVFGDVSGKGPAAALLAAMLQGIFSADAPKASGPAAALRRANEVLIERRLETQFATVVYVVLHADGRLAYSNAGHNPPVLLSGGEIKRLTTGGPILGVFRDAEFHEETLRLRPNATLVMFTDGITEATDRSGEEFGEQRLLATLGDRSDCPPQEIVQKVLDAARAHSQGAEQFDDMTVAAARFLHL